ncbi:GIY-YIG nuclease family protein [Sphingomonas sp. 1P06PA]|uniref:GIY-YIG nuclease family protein n=1 Tax=Sphingomonas sp. 1P06PA TaxID=554121 RepID=UPI0039A78297
MGDATPKQLLRYFYEPNDRAMPWDSPRFVYFARGTDGLIKIGCGYVPRNRIKAVRDANGARPEFLAAMPGSFALEKRVHSAFWQERQHGEWFTATPQLEALIAHIRDEFGEPAKPSRKPRFAPARLTNTGDGK